MFESLALPYGARPVIEGIALHDNREETFERLANDVVESTTEYSLNELPPEFQEHLVSWFRTFFYWELEQRRLSSPFTT